MKKTYMANNYKYYVYVCPGNIRYFNDLEEAELFAQEKDAKVQTMDT